VASVITSSVSPRLVYWVKTLSKFVSVQIIVQIVGIASGILLVRTLDQREYAYFTIANAMFSTIHILADSGVGIGLSSIGGRVWQNPHRFGQLITTAMRLRRYLAAAAIVVVTPIFIWMLVSKEASGIYAGVIALVVLLGLNYQLSVGVLSVVPRLHSQIGRVQKLDFIAALSRLVLLVAAYFIFLNAAVAILATFFSVLVQYFFLRRWVADSIEVDAPASPEDRSTIVEIVKSQMPNSIFYCLQGQVTIWLISVFGSTQNIAEVGALSRLGIILAVVISVMTSIVLPHFARCQSPTQLRSRYFQIVGAFILFGLTLIFAAMLFPAPLLWILGNKYAHLRGELVLMMLMTAVSSVVTAMWSLNYTRAWIKHSWLNIPFVLMTQACLLLLLDVSTLAGVLWFGTISLIPTFLLNAVLTCRGLAAMRHEQGVA
jgi:O-antigen/teichoic acid export membrane protein